MLTSTILAAGVVSKKVKRAASTPVEAPAPIIIRKHANPTGSLLKMTMSGLQKEAATRQKAKEISDTGGTLHAESESKSEQKLKRTAR